MSLMTFLLLADDVASAGYILLRKGAQDYFPHKTSFEIIRNTMCMFFTNKLLSLYITYPEVEILIVNLQRIISNQLNT